MMTAVGRAHRRTRTFGWFPHMATVPAIRRPHTPPPAPVGSPADRLSVRIPASACTLAGFRAWATSDAFPEHVRASFLDEEIYLDMSNEDPETHVGVKTEIVRVLAALNRVLKLGKFYGDGLLVTNEAAGVSNNPDASFLSRDSLLTGRVRVVPREGREGRFVDIEGTPDWVLEVISDSSVENDTDRLRAAYHRAGIREYWLIDARGDDLVFQILHWRKTGYAAAPARDGWQRSRVFGRAFRLLRRRDDLGLWEYTLELRPESP
jgi:Uma2 family endonuclease